MSDASVSRISEDPNHPSNQHQGDLARQNARSRRLHAVADEGDQQTVPASTRSDKSVGRGLVSAGLGVGMLAAAALGAKTAGPAIKDTIDRVNPPSGSHVEVPIFEEGLQGKQSEASPNVLVVAAGANVRETPFDGGDNVAWRVPEGKALTIGNGVRVNGWIGFQERDEQGNLPDLGEHPSAQDIAQHTLWVNVGGLSQEHKNGGPDYLISYERPGQADGLRISAELRSDGHFYEPLSGNAIAGGQLVDADSVQERMDQDGFVPIS